jgi:hypothetical protein
MLIPVTPEFYCRLHLSDSVLARKLKSTDGSMLPVELTHLLARRPAEFGSELTTTVAMAGMCLFVQPVSACNQLPFGQPLGIRVEKREAVLSPALLHRLSHSVSQPQPLQ